MGKVELARLIKGMSYEDLRDVGDALHSMTQKDGGDELWDLADKRDWAEVLYRWAEATVDEVQELKAA